MGGAEEQEGRNGLRSGHVGCGGGHRGVKRCSAEVAYTCIWNNAWVGGCLRWMGRSLERELSFEWVEKLSKWNGEGRGLVRLQSGEGCRMSARFAVINGSKKSA